MEVWLRAGWGQRAHANSHLSRRPTTPGQPSWNPDSTQCWVPTLTSTAGCCVGACPPTVPGPLLAATSPPSCKADQWPQGQGSLPATQGGQQRQKGEAQGEWSLHRSAPSWWPGHLPLQGTPKARSIQPGNHQSPDEAALTPKVSRGLLSELLAEGCALLSFLGTVFTKTHT